MLAARRVAADEAHQPGRAGALLQQGRRQTAVERTGRHDRGAAGRRRRRHGRLVKHHTVDHRRRQDGRRRGLRVLRNGRLGRDGTGKRRHAVIGQVRAMMTVMMVVTVQRRRRRRRADLRVARGRIARWRWRRWTLERAGHH